MKLTFWQDVALQFALVVLFFLVMTAIDVYTEHRCATVQTAAEVH